MPCSARLNGGTHGTQCMPPSKYDEHRVKRSWLGPPVSVNVITSVFGKIRSSQTFAPLHRRTTTPTATKMSKPVEAVRAALEEDVMQLRLHVGGSFAGELPHVYVSFAFGSTKDCSMEPVRDDGVCNSAHVQALRVRADPSRMWARVHQLAPQRKSCLFHGQDSKTSIWQLRIQSTVGAAPGMVCR